MKKWNKKLAASLLACAMLATTLTGCDIRKLYGELENGAQADPVAAQGDGAPTADILLELQQKYADIETNEYTEPVYGIPRDGALEVEIGFDPFELGMESYDEVCAVFQNAELTSFVGVEVDSQELDNGNNRLSLTPRGQLQPLRISYSSDMDGDKVSMAETDTNFLYDRGPGNDWGNLAQYYFAVFVDLETGEPLETPQVTVFTIQHEVKAPKIEFFITDDGVGGFKWDAVPGATHYYVLKSDITERGGVMNASIIAETTETEWTAPKKYDSIINSAFRGTKEYDQNVYIFVVAATATDTSAASNMYHKGYLGSLLPYSIATTANEGLEEGEAYTKRPSSIGLMPSHALIEMCDGSITQRLLYYDWENMVVEAKDWDIYEEDDDGNLTYLGKPEGDVLRIPFWPEGTPFKAVTQLSDDQYDPDTMLAELLAIAQRQEALRGNSGTLDVTLEEVEDEEIQTPGTEQPDPQPAPDPASSEPASDPASEPTSEPASSDPASSEPTQDPDPVGNGQINYDGSIEVFGSTALSEWIAIHLVAGEEYIDLTPFREASDSDYLAEAFFEAMYQNPLALGVEGAGIGYGNTLMIIYYNDDQETMLKKQAEVRAEVQRVVAEVVTPGMSELEISYALNDYLCDTVEYDYAALENAEMNNFAYVDESFNDSFTAYGALIDGVGVCASYSAAYKLLADEAGLECVVVNGTLLGSLSHAWNRVNINGTWDTVDVTNNDNEAFYNVLMNLSDEGAGMMLIEDDTWMMSAYIQNYTSDSDDNEYYRVQGNYYDKGEIAKQLVAGLQNEGKVVLRTEYALSEADFNMIANEVVNTLGANNIYGGYMLGAIYMELG